MALWLDKGGNTGHKGFLQNKSWKSVNYSSSKVCLDTVNSRISVLRFIQPSPTSAYGSSSCVIADAVKLQSRSTKHAAPVTLGRIVSKTITRYEHTDVYLYSMPPSAVHKDVCLIFVPARMLGAGGCGPSGPGPGATPAGSSHLQPPS